MLLALVRAGLLEQDTETRRYHLGPEAYVLGTLASRRFGLHPISVGSLVRICEATGDTAFLSVPHDIYSICLHREEGSYPIRSYALHAGDRHPLGIGAGSLALLAALSDREVEQVLAAIAEILKEKYPTYSPSLLRELVKEARSKGFALNRRNDPPRLLGHRSFPQRTGWSTHRRTLRSSDREPHGRGAPAGVGAAP